MVLRRPASWPAPPGRRNGLRMVLVLRRHVRSIQSRAFSEKRRTILLLLGEQAGMRESVQTNFFRVAGWMCRCLGVGIGARLCEPQHCQTASRHRCFERVLIGEAAAGRRPARRVRRDGPRPGWFFLDKIFRGRKVKVKTRFTHEPNSP